MFKNRWIQFTLLFALTLAMRIFLLGELSLIRNIVESAALAIFFSWIVIGRPNFTNKKDNNSNV